MSFGTRQSDVRAAQSEKDRAAVRVSEPVQILEFYPDKMTVDVQPMIKTKIDGKYTSSPPLMGLRVACLCASDFVIRPWYKRGDIGWMLVSDFDADLVMRTGQESEPNTERNHAPEDALFIGGVCPEGMAPTGLPPESLALATAEGEIYIALTKDKILIKGDIEHTGNVTHTGNTVQTGRTDVTVDVTAQNKSLATHTHNCAPGVTSGPN